MGFSPESYTIMTMCRLQTNKYYYFSKFQVLAQPYRNDGVSIVDF